MVYTSYSVASAKFVELLSTIEPPMRKDKDMQRIQNHAEPRHASVTIADVREFLDEDPRHHPANFSETRMSPPDIERRLASILQDPGFGTLYRMQRAFDRMSDGFDD